MRVERVSNGGNVALTLQYNVWRTTRIVRIIGEPEVPENLIHILDHTTSATTTFTQYKILFTSYVDQFAVAVAATTYNTITITMTTNTPAIFKWNVAVQPSGGELTYVEVDLVAGRYTITGLLSNKLYPIL